MEWRRRARGKLGIVSLMGYRRSLANSSFKFTTRFNLPLCFTVNELERSLDVIPLSALHDQRTATDGNVGSTTRLPF